MNAALTVIHTPETESSALELGKVLRSELSDFLSEYRIYNSTQLPPILEGGIFFMMSDSVLTMENLLISDLPYALILFNPKINEKLKEKLYSVKTPTLIISCLEKKEFDSNSTSFHDLISGSKMKILHKCNPSELGSKENSVARIVREFISDLMIK